MSKMHHDATTHRARANPQSTSPAAAHHAQTQIAIVDSGIAAATLVDETGI